MPGPVNSFVGGIQDYVGARALSVISSNSRVKTAQGFVGLITDTVLFPGPPGSGAAVTGNWVSGNTRVMVQGTPTVGASSMGLAYGTAASTPVSGPMIVVQGDSKVQGA